MNTGRVAAIILAAGYSSRMQDFKPLLPLGAMTVIERVVAGFRKAGVSDIRAVVGHRAREITPLLQKLDVHWVMNERYHEGMFSSVAAGAAGLGAETEAFFVMPVDIPLVRTRTLGDLLEAGRCASGAVVHPTFEGRRGHPPLIPGRCAEEIPRWSGSGGLRAYLEAKGGKAVEVETADEYILLDLDSPADYQELLSRLKSYDIPSSRECMALLTRRLLVSQDVVEHSRTVTRAALRMTEALNSAGLDLDRHLVEAGGLLHDLAKGQPNHAATGAQWLRELGFPRVASVVGVHVDITIQEDEPVDEREVVHLADKLVQGSRMVPLEERFQRKIQRYGRDSKVRAIIARRLFTALKIKERIEQATGALLEGLVSD